MIALSLVAGEFVGVGICCPAGPFDFLLGGPSFPCSVAGALGDEDCSGAGGLGVGFFAVPSVVLVFWVVLLAGFSAAPCGLLGRVGWVCWGVVVAIGMMV